MRVWLWHCVGDGQCNETDTLYCNKQIHCMFTKVAKRLRSALGSVIFE